VSSKLWGFELFVIELVVVSLKGRESNDGVD
jgi:hypothetical protein